MRQKPLVALPQRFQSTIQYMEALLDGLAFCPRLQAEIQLKFGPLHKQACSFPSSIASQATRCQFKRLYAYPSCRLGTSQHALGQTSADGAVPCKQACKSRAQASASRGGVGKCPCTGISLTAEPVQKKTTAVCNTARPRVLAREQGHSHGQEGGTARSRKLKSMGVQRTKMARGRLPLHQSKALWCTHVCCVPFGFAVAYAVEKRPQQRPPA